MKEAPKKAVILLSGGLDSATVAAIAKRDGYELYAISFKYGQRHEIEMDYAKKLVEVFEIVQHKIAEIDLRLFGGSALTDDIDVPKNREIVTGEIPVTYVPARNTIFLSFALAYAETVGAFDIFIGANVVDYSGYPDCRPEYLQAFEGMANLATAATINSDQRFKIIAPLLRMNKSDIIKTGLELGVNYSSTISCYDPKPNGKGCGECDSCQIRKKAFAENGMQDPSLSS